MTVKNKLGRKSRNIEKIEEKHKSLLPPPLYTLICSKKWSSAEIRIDTHPEEAEYQDDEGGTALHAACFVLAPVHVVRHLVSACPKIVSLKTYKQGSTALHIACLRGAFVEVMQILMHANPSSVQMSDSVGLTPLHLACLRYGFGSSSADILEVLINAAPTMLFQKDLSGRTPLSIVLGEYEPVVCAAVSKVEKQRLSKKRYLERQRNASNPSTPPGMQEQTHSYPPVVLSELYKDDRDTLRSLQDCWDKLSLMIFAAFKLQSPLPIDPVWRIVHACAGVKECSLSSFPRLAMLVHPEQIREHDEGGRLPIHIAAGSTTSDERDTQLMNIVLDAYPDGLRISDKNGLLPLAHAVRSGKTWSNGVKKLFLLYPDAIHTLDFDLRLYPRVFSMLDQNTNFSTLYTVLRAHPDIVVALSSSSDDVHRLRRDESSKTSKPKVSSLKCNCAVM